MSFLRKVMSKIGGRQAPDQSAVGREGSPQAGLPDDVQSASNDDGDEGRIVLCIPGPWADQREFVRALLTSQLPEADYLALGMIMMHTPTKTGFEFDWQPRDEDLARAFGASGSIKRFSDVFIRSIDEHRSVVYLLSMEEPSKAVATDLAKAAAAVTRAGGLAVKVESAGTAFAAETWQDLNSTAVVDIYRLMVVDAVTDDDLAFSCGMHNLGMPDASVAGEEKQYAADLLRSFNMYQAYEEPDLQEGHTFSAEENAPKYRLSMVENQPYEEGLFHNPYGMWRLTRVTTH